MPYDFKLPDLGEGIAEVELRRWLVKEGDRVAEHQGILEVETDKAVVEVPAPRGGTILRIHCQEGETVRVGENIITITETGDESAAAAPRRSVGIVGELPEAEEEPQTATKGASGAGEVLATPLVRKLARERGIDLRTVQGS